jgi:hypothetical protein
MLQNENNSVRHKRKDSGRNKAEAGKFDICEIRTPINKLHVTEGQRSTLKVLLPVLKKKLDFRAL